MATKRRSTKTSPLPTTRAKTAYGLLSDVRRLILEEPRRYCQERYICRVGGKRGADVIGRPNWFDGYTLRAPACGTVGCVAGWVATLLRGDKFHYDTTSDIARKALGLDTGQASELFDSDAFHTTAMPQTKRYARAGAKHIQRFQQRYAKQLRATPVRTRQR